MKFSTKGTFFMIYLLLLGICGQVTHVLAENVGSANTFIDAVLENLRNFAPMVAQFDPLNIPDVKEREFEAKDIVIRGLSSLYRSGDFSVTYDGEVATVIGEIAVKNVNMFTSYGVKALFFWIKGWAVGRVDSLAVKIILTAKGRRAQLSLFKVTKLGQYKITKITGASFALNWLLKIIANFFAKKSRGKIIDAVETGAAKALNGLLSKVPIPLHYLKDIAFIILIISLLPF